LFHIGANIVNIVEKLKFIRDQRLNEIQLVQNLIWKSQTLDHYQRIVDGCNELPFMNILILMYGQIFNIVISCSRSFVRSCKYHSIW